jgi:hypothetical protein
LALLRETIGKVPHSAPVLAARRDTVTQKEKGPAEAEPDLPAASRQKIDKFRNLRPGAGIRPDQLGMAGKVAISERITQDGIFLCELPHTAFGPR